MTEHVTARPNEAAGSSPGSRWWALAVISLAQMMITLDTTIVAVALPSAQNAVGMDDVERQWTVTAYAVAFGGLLLLGGRLGDLLGRRHALTLGVAGFAGASALGGAAEAAGVLIAARALQGVFAALVAPAALSLIGATFTDGAERVRALGVFSAISMSGGAAGLVLGGVLTSYLDWRWCLYVNVPIAAVVLVGTVAAVPSPGRQPTRLDVPGAMLASAGMVALIFGLGESAERGWDSGVIIGALALAATLLVAFVLGQRRAASPLLPLHLLTARSSGTALLAMAITAFCMLGMFLAMTYQLQTVMGLSAARTGLAFLAYVAVAGLVSTLAAGRLLERFGARIMISGGLLTCAAGLVLLTRLTPESTYIYGVLPALILFGLGVGNLAVPIYATAMSGGQAHDAGTVPALVNTAQQIGGATGVAVLNTIAITTTAAYSATHGSGSTAGVVHGLTVALGSAAAVATVGALITWALIGQRRLTEGPARMERT